MTTDVKFRSDVDVELVEVSASDLRVAKAAWVSTKGSRAEDEGNPDRIAGLINYLVRDRHGSPFEHTSFTFAIRCPIFVVREFHRHRAGWCLAGDTEIWQESWGTGDKPQRSIRKRSVAELWDNWHNGVPDSMGRRRKLESVRNFKVRTMDEATGKFILSKVTNIYKNDSVQMYRTTLKNGMTIKTSIDHLFWTDSGWAKLGELSIGDVVGVTGRVFERSGAQYPPSLRRGIGVWTSMQRASIIGDGTTCNSCNELFAAKDMELDHIVPVVSDLSKALDASNLQALCKDCHRSKTDSEQILAARPEMTAGVNWSEIESIEKLLIEESYDIELEGPNRGFVANGFVVHNSYNEESGRYTKLQPEFYVPARDRNLVQTGKPGHYVFGPGSDEQYENVDVNISNASWRAWDNYEDMLEHGIAKEVARMCLPLNIYTSFYATCNSRSLMHFLSLRTENESATYPSHPQFEIQLVANAMEEHFKTQMPITWEAWNRNGRVAP